MLSEMKRLACAWPKPTSYTGEREMGESWSPRDDE
jgi:hypothetical protein